MNNILVVVPEARSSSAAAAPPASFLPSRAFRARVAGLAAAFVVLCWAALPAAAAPALINGRLINPETSITVSSITLSQLTNSTTALMLSVPENGATNNTWLAFKSAGGIFNYGQFKLAPNAISLSLDAINFGVIGGNVGIGTTAPATTLDVNGSAQFGSGATKSTFTATGDLKVSGSIGTNGTTPIVSLDVGVGATVASTGISLPALSAAQIRSGSPVKTGVLIFNATSNQVCVTTGTAVMQYANINGMGVCQ